MVDLFLYRAPEEQEKDEAAQAAEEPAFQRPGYTEGEGGSAEWPGGAAPAAENWGEGAPGGAAEWGKTGDWGASETTASWDSSVVAGATWDAQTE